MTKADLYQEALKFLKDKNIPSLTDRGYIARWMTDFAIQQLKHPISLINNSICDCKNRRELWEKYQCVDCGKLYIDKTN